MNLVSRLSLAISSLLLVAQPISAGIQDKCLDIYFIDVEGGAATLIVTPKGESILVDSGNPNDRDPLRILHVVMETAKLRRIDHHIITHWHGDHFGGTQALATQLPIGNFYDHGDSIEFNDFGDKFDWYLKLSEGRRTILTAGDQIKLNSNSADPRMKLLCLCSAGKVLPDKDGSQPVNTQCDLHTTKPKDTSDNRESVGFKLSFGSFDFLDLGDLTWNIEHKLVCPENRIGVVDVYQTNHHGLPSSNHPALVHAIAPRVAVMNNGSRKGGEPPLMSTLGSSSDIEAIFQVHRNVRADAQNVPPKFIANLQEKCEGDYVWIKVAPDAASYQVAAGQKGQVFTYKSR